MGELLRLFLLIYELNNYDLLSRPDIEVPKPPPREEIRNAMDYRDTMTDMLGVEPNFHFWPSANTSAWEEYQLAMHNKSLWILKEQERIAFDVKKGLTG